MSDPFEKVKRMFSGLMSCAKNWKCPKDCENHLLVDFWPIPLIYFLQPFRISKAYTSNGSVWITEQTLARSRPGFHNGKGGGPTAETQMAMKLERSCRQWLTITCLCRWSKAIKESLKAAHSNGQGSRFPLQRLNTTKITKWKFTFVIEIIEYACMCFTMYCVPNISAHTCLIHFCSLLSGAFISKASEIVIFPSFTYWCVNQGTLQDNKPTGPWLPSQRRHVDIAGRGVQIASKNQAMSRPGPAIKKKKHGLVQQRNLGIPWILQVYSVRYHGAHKALATGNLGLQPQLQASPPSDANHIQDQQDLRKTPYKYIIWKPPLWWVFGGSKHIHIYIYRYVYIYLYIHIFIYTYINEINLWWQNESFTPPLAHIFGSGLLLCTSLAILFASTQKGCISLVFNPVDSRCAKNGKSFGAPALSKQQACSCHVWYHCTTKLRQNHLEVHIWKA